MNKKREAILWSMMITTSIMLGLIVVWGAIVLAFSQTVLAPLYFVAAPYHQDDYSAEGVNAVRFNRLDPALEQEALREDGMRDRLTAPAASPTLQHQPSATQIRFTPATQPLSTSTLAPTSTIFPGQTQTSKPVSTNTRFPTSTNTVVRVPVSTSTQVPTSTTFSVLTDTPQASNTPLSPPNTPKPPNTPPPPNTPKPPNTPPPPNTKKPPNTPPPPNTKKPPNTPPPPKTPKHHRHLESSESRVLLAQENSLPIKCDDDPINCSGGSSSIVRTKYLVKWFTLRLAQFI